MAHGVSYMIVMPNILSMKNIFSWIGLIALFYGIHWLWNWQDSNTDELKRTGELTIGKIESYGNNVITEYEVNGEIFKRKRSQPFSGLQDGEQYYVAYNPTNPEEYAVIYERPHIDDSTEYEIISPIEVSRIPFNSRQLNFRYRVNGKEYKRTQKVYSQSEFSEVTNLNVIFNKENPRIAYLSN